MIMMLMTEISEFVTCGVTKTYTSIIIKRLVTEKYSFDSRVREHILKSNMASKFKTMDMGLKDEILVHLVMSSLPKEFEAFQINYNSQSENWEIEKLIVMCVQRMRELRMCVVVLSTT
jgi:hypothetical protein